MKKIIMASLACFVFSFTLMAQTAEEVVAKFEAAAGGREKLEAIHSLQVESVMKMSMMRQDFTININSIKEKGKLYRREMSGIMGIGNSFSMVTDTAGYSYIPAMPGFGGGGGSEPALIKMTDAELKAQQFELDCAGMFAPLVNYAAKGGKVELAGTDKVNKQECFKVKLTLASGGQLTYYINSKDYSVMQLDAAGEMAANITGFGSMMKMMGNDRVRSMKASIGYSNYKDLGGVQFPMKQVIAIGPVETVIEHSDIKINEAVDPIWYRLKK
ncbi:hypothetical protein [Sediminibacterium ginsengisoli]|uniref:DUF4412 domain-containing protein n=1 Tax=Sediminibacterium ginsengisoli TaxID=413434 RepID=A0A1T4NDA7_9BACT|nr:hypothetical protein [Sediminibacterium ginsengisoli]SJZ77269.1 hypothetical protein SAMN04488132_104207 [Sediminibacterium ginsengisoli]